MLCSASACRVVRRSFACGLLFRHYSAVANGIEKAQSRKRTIFSGIQPTGIPHLGNYLGALKNWVALEKSASDDDTVIFSIVDLHAITIPQQPAQLRKAKRELLASLLAIGLSPDRCILYEQSTVPEHTELSWILSTLAPLGALNRMTQFKSKARIKTGRADEFEDENLNGIMLGLFAYPVLQAADILLYKTTLVPVGEDQAQHLELSRTLAKAFNAQFGKNTFPIPETLLSSSAGRVSDLREPSKKMSKSAPNEKSRISIIEEESVIRTKIGSAMTDSHMGVTYDPLGRPGVSNLLDIYASLTNRPGEMSAIVTEIKHLSHKAVKDLVADTVITSLSPVRERYLALDVDSKGGQQRLQDISAQGTRKAQVIARKTMQEVRQQMGLL